MGNNLTISLERKKKIFNTLLIEYELLKSKKIMDKQIFEIMVKKYDELIDDTYCTSLRLANNGTQVTGQKTKQIQTVDLFDIDLSGVDGVIKTDTYTLVGWKNGNEEIDLDGLEETLKKNDKNGNN